MKYRQIVSMLLAAQMIGAPLAQAAEALSLEAPPAVEAPAASRALPGDNAGFNLGWISYGYKQYGAGKVSESSTGSEIDVAVEKDWKKHIDPNQGGEEWIQWLAGNDGTYTLDGLMRTSWEGEDFGNLVKFRDLEGQLGRIPDMEFDGWYVYGGGGPWKISNEQNENWKIPQAAFRLDYKLDPNDPIDMVAVRDTILESNDEILAKLTEQELESNARPYDSTDLPIIAHWKPSGDARLIKGAKVNRSAPGGDRPYRATAFYGVTKNKEGTATVGTENLLAGTLYAGDPNKGGTVTKFDPEKNQTYYLRVNTEVEALDLSLLAAEPYREKNNVAGGVTVSAKQAGEKECKGYPLIKTSLNESVPVEGEEKQHSLYNSLDFPMRSQWTLAEGTYIPLALSTADSYYNEVQVKVTAPDGETTNTYTFYIQRLNDPKLEQDPGNTPLGMIQRDKGHVWDVGGKTREAAKALFQEKRNFGALDDAGYTLGGGENNGGQFGKKNTYWADAWGGKTDLDLMKTAIVAYQDSSFVDPGFTVVDSQGNRVEIGTGQENVKRSVTLRVAAEGLTVSHIKDGAGETYYVTEDGLEPATEVGEAAFQIVRDENGQDQIDLRGARVVPGIYSIEYAFTDPLTKKTYTSDPADFLPGNEDNAGTFSRPLVILPIPGDVDMDGAVTALDAELLRRALDPEDKEIVFLGGEDAVTALFKHRVCDVNNDGQVDEADVERLQAGYTPRVEEEYFYLPLPAGGNGEDWHQRKELTMAQEEGKGALSLEFLGKNTDTVTKDPSSLNELNSPTDELKLGDKFWVGVKVDLDQLIDNDAPKAIRGGITAINLTIAYDSTYLEPVAAFGERNFDQKAWIEMLTKYNIGTNDSADRFQWSKHYEVAPGTRAGGAYTTHYSKAILPMEQLMEPKNLREVTVSLRCKDTVYRFLDRQGGQDGYYALPGEQGGEDSYYLLRLPFRLHKFPFGKTQLKALDMGLGMKELSMLSYLRPEDSGQPPVSAAWSAQDRIFGGATWNLAKELSYVGGSARAIPLGENETARVDLINYAPDSQNKTVYGEEYKSEQLQVGLHDLRLPKGLTYKTGVIEGIPQEVGTFEFQTADGTGDTTIYRITVEKAPLTLTAAPQTRYYGESDKLDYTYNEAEIKALDLPGGANYDPKVGFDNDGTSAQLAKLAGYRAPQLTTDAVPGSGVGEYAITIGDAVDGSGLTNYTFRYSAPDGTPDGDGGSAESLLTILPRPLKIASLVDRGENSAMADVLVWANDPRTVFPDQRALYKKGGPEQFVPETLNGTYDGLTLTGDPVYGTDTVELSFTAGLTWENNTAPYYNLNGAASKIVAAAISGMKLVGDTAGNYTLVESLPRTAQATIYNNPVKTLRVESVPKLEGYTYGETFRMQGMKVTPVYADGSDQISYQYSTESSFNVPGIIVTWEDSQGSGPSVDETHLLTDGKALEAAVHNGKYLCVSMPCYPGAAERVSWYSETPLTVSKRS